MSLILLFQVDFKKGELMASMDSLGDRDDATNAVPPSFLEEEYNEWVNEEDDVVDNGHGFENLLMSGARRGRSTDQQPVASMAVSRLPKVENTVVSDATPPLLPPPPSVPMQDNRNMSLPLKSADDDVLAAVDELADLDGSVELLDDDTTVGWDGPWGGDDDSHLRDYER